MCFLFLLSIVCFVFNDLMYELVLHYVDIGGIVDTHDLAFLFNNTFLPMSTIFLSYLLVYCLSSINGLSYLLVYCLSSINGLLYLLVYCLSSYL
jgi:hypothetical protein